MTITPTQATARYRARHPDRVKAQRQARSASEQATARARRASPERWGAVNLPNLRHRAKKNGMLCTVQASDLIVPEVCPVLGTPFTFGGERGSRTSSTNPSVDRFNNDLGYVPGNVRIISLRANMLKSDATVEELERVLAYMKGEVL